MDVVALLNQTALKYHPLFEPESNRLKWQFRRRTFPLHVPGRVSLKHAILYLLPRRFQNPERISAIGRCAEDELRSAFDRWQSADGFQLFGHPFRSISTTYEMWQDLLLLVTEAVVRDQYEARKYIREDAIVIDAGANLGVFCVTAANLARNGRVYGFEPAPKTYETLTRNVGPYSNISPINAALGDRPGTSEILMYDLGSGGNALVDSEMVAKIGLDSFHGRHTVNVSTIDAFVEERKLDSVDYLKIDTEGYEKQILRGAEQTIRKWSPVIGVSAYHLKGDKEEIPRLVRSFNHRYQCRLLQKFEEVFILTAS